MIAPKNTNQYAFTFRNTKGIDYQKVNQIIREHPEAIMEVIIYYGTNMKEYIAARPVEIVRHAPINEINQKPSTKYAEQTRMVGV